jgi:hypothetical protein
VADSHAGDFAGNQITIGYMNMAVKPRSCRAHAVLLLKGITLRRLPKLQQGLQGIGSRAGGGQTA